MGIKISKALHRHHSPLGRVSAVLAAVVAAVSISTDGISATGRVDYDSLIADKEAEIQEMQQKNDQRREQISNINGDISDNEEAISLISDQIEGVTAQILLCNEKITVKETEISDKSDDIAAVEQGIADKEKEIERKGIEIDNLRKQNEENLEKFSRLVRALYMNDTSDTIPLLNGSDDWYNFFVYSDVVQNISGQNLDFMNALLDAIHNQEQMIQELDEQILGLENDKSKLEQDKAELEKKKAELEDERANLEDYKNTQYNDLYLYTVENQTLANKVNNLEYAISATAADIEQANKDIEEIIRQKQAANSSQTVYSSDGFRWPLAPNQTLITTYFGYDSWRGGNHYGIDVGNAGIGGSPIYAAQSGTVITAYNDSGWHGGYGNYVVIDHGDSLSTLYAHCVSTCVYEGQVVNKGDVIGYVGTTGWSTGNHLHFEVRVGGVAQNPLGYEYEYVY